MNQEYLEQLRQALAAGDSERALGAVRLLEASGGLERLSPELLSGAAAVCEQAGLYEQAARLLELGAARGGGRAGELRWRACCLLAGPARRPDLAADGARRLLAGEDDRYRQRAAHLLQALADGDGATLGRLLATAGVEAQSPEPAPLAEPATPAARPASAGIRPPLTVTPLARWLTVGLVVCLLAWLAGRFMRERLSGVGEIDERLLAEPRQQELSDPEPLRLTRGDFHLTLYPRYGYRICGLVVSVNTYAKLGLRFQDFYERDLCMVWGDNVSSRAFQAPGASFEHHGNVCYAQWRGPVGIRGNQLSNTHIFSADGELRRAAARLRRGDQVCLEGKLVDVTAVPRRAPAGGGVPAPARLRTSTSRDDKGIGACEILLLQKLEVLARGNRPWRLLASGGFWGAILFLVLLVARALRRSH